MKTFRCDKHDSTQERRQFCTACAQAFSDRRDADTMTAEERAAEFEWWGNILTIPFNDLHQRIEELVGRSVWTHELAYPEQLIQEIRTGRQASISDVLDKIPSDLPVVVVSLDPLAERTPSYDD